MNFEQQVLKKQGSCRTKVSENVRLCSTYDSRPKERIFTKAQQRSILRARDLQHKLQNHFINYLQWTRRNLPHHLRANYSGAKAFYMIVKAKGKLSSAPIKESKSLPSSCKGAFHKAWVCHHHLAANCWEAREQSSFFNLISRIYSKGSQGGRQQ